MPSHPRPKKAQPQIRVSGLANDHLEKIVRALRKQGLIVNKTSFTSSLILNCPIPNGNHPVSRAEVRQMNQEAMQ